MSPILSDQLKSRGSSGFFYLMWQTNKKLPTVLFLMCNDVNMFAVVLYQISQARKISTWFKK